MKSFLNKAMLTLVVFGLAIVSSFAMETDPPTEPVKTTVETEVVTDNLEKTTFLEEGYGYKDASDNCILISEGSPEINCSPTNLGNICEEIPDGEDEPHTLYFMSRDTPPSPWVCGAVLRKP